MKGNQYRHFCPAARALEVIGEKWSLLIVRDLLRGPQRFTDLQAYLGNITPKWLTLRLRELEAAGIVERHSEPGRREVWYSLTPRGQDLRPVVESLMVWGARHVARPPIPGEALHPEQFMEAVVSLLNQREARLPRPTVWQLRFDGARDHTLVFDGERWSTRTELAAAPDLTIACAAEDWLTFLSAKRRERARLVERLVIDGPSDRKDEFLSTYRIDERSLTSAATRH